MKHFIYATHTKSLMSIYCENCEEKFIVATSDNCCPVCANQFNPHNHFPAVTGISVGELDSRLTCGQCGATIFTNDQRPIEDLKSLIFCPTCGSGDVDPLEGLPHARSHAEIDNQRERCLEIIQSAISSTAGDDDFDFFLATLRESRNSRARRMEFDENDDGAYEEVPPLEGEEDEFGLDGFNSDDECMEIGYLEEIDPEAEKNADPDGVFSTTFCTLQTQNGWTARICHNFESSVSELAQAGLVDAFITACEDGFSPLGAAKAFIAEDLGISEREITRLANEIRYDSTDVKLAALSSRRSDGRLKGVILAASETSACYEQFATPFYGRPYRDFYYNVTYEAIAYACQTWRARRLALSHLSASGCFHPDIATCTAEALTHFCDDSLKPIIESLTFVGCCISPNHLADIWRLNDRRCVTRHRPIQVDLEERRGCEIIRLAWGNIKSGR